MKATLAVPGLTLILATLASVPLQADPTPLPPLSRVATTVEETRAPRKRPAPTRATLDPRIPSDVLKLLGLGYGDLESRPGEPIRDLTLDGSKEPASGAKITRLSRFLHLADVQLTDDESPVRVARLDSTSLSSAFRPQESHGCHLLNSAVRTINALHRQDPLDFVMMGGDNIDNAQSNELDWFLSILAGAPSVECDSGRDNRPPVGADAYFPKVPFAPVGLDIPWYWVTGNHDVLVQGNFKPAAHRRDAVGGYSKFGARVWEFAGGPVKTGPIEADPRRALLSGEDLLEIVAKDGDGHGIGGGELRRGKANYVTTHGDIRFIIFDTSADSGAAGVAKKQDIESFLLPALRAAAVDKKHVVVVTHHVSMGLSRIQAEDGSVIPEAITATAWRELLGSHPNVILHLAAHSHHNLIIPVKSGVDHAYWEVQTAALIDYPNQLRTIEIHDQDNGYLTVTGVSVDVATQGDELGLAALKLATMDLTSGWTGSGAGRSQDRNVRLWIKK